MGADAALPPGLWERIRQVVRDELGKLLRSGLLRNASISEGGLTIRGGFLKLIDKILGVSLFYVGPVSPDKVDGSPQQGWIVRRADGTVVLLLRDAFPTDSGGALNQALTWFDRSGNVVLSDDTDGGTGLARPHLPSALYPTRTQDFLVSTSAAFETILRARVEKQQPKLYVEAWAFADTAGTTGEVQVTVNGAPFGVVGSVTNSLVGLLQFGPAVANGAFGDVLNVEVQARRTAGTGNILVGASLVSGWQS